MKGLSRPLSLFVSVAIATACAVTDAQAQHIHTASGLPHNIPDFCASPTVVSTNSGAWSNPANWTPARVPAATDIVAVANGTSINYDIVSDAAVRCVGVSGELRFATATSTRMTVVTLMVMATGRLEVGSESAPITANAKAEIVFADGAIDTTIDPEQYGTGLLAFGSVRMHGAIRTPTFTRTTVEPRAGAATLSTETAVTGWRPGDRLIVPDTRHLRWNEVYANYVPQWEELSLAVSAGSQLTLTGALRFDHMGARTTANVLEFLPHVGNLTRNVVLRSANPGGIRGHAIFTARADVDIRYALFKDMGRTTVAELDSATFDSAGTVTHVGTNQIGRYPIHMHHLMGPTTVPATGFQYTLIGNAVEGSPKWGITIHNSHYGQVRGNVMYNIDGAQLMTEDGSESYNVIEGNLAVRGTGTGGRQAGGREGVGFYFKGPNNYVRNNVAANFLSDNVDSAYGYKYFSFYLGNVKIPNFPGADTTVDGQYTTKHGNGIPILEFARNEVYGATESGMTYWWLGTEDLYPILAAPESVIRDLRVWHVFNRGIFHYPANRVTIDGLILRGKDPASAACCGIGILIGDYMARYFVLRNSDIQGMTVGIEVGSFTDTAAPASPTQAFTTELIQNSKFLGNIVGVDIPTLYTSAFHSGSIPPREVAIRNVKFDAAPSPTQTTIRLRYTTEGARNLMQRDEVFVYNYNQVSGDDFRVYYNEQRPDFVVPQTIWSDATNTYAVLTGSPVAGLTNQQLWSNYGQAIAGKVAPCQNARAGVGGIVCGMTGGPSGLGSGAPSAPSNVRIIR